MQGKHSEAMMELSKTCRIHRYFLRKNPLLFSVLMFLQIFFLSKGMAVAVKQLNADGLQGHREWLPVSQRSKVDHHPGQGHWFNAGLSPNINVTSQVGLHNIPQFQAVPYAHANSYGSIGSYGSYNDGFGMGSSYGSYGDRVNTFVYCSPAGPSALNVRTQGRVAFLGSSPDARRASSQFPYGGGLGVSPSAGSFTQLAHTTSSSHTPPGSYSQIPAGSPGLDGPTSPARGNNHGSPLGKTAAANQFNRRKSWGYPGSLQSQDQHSRVHFIDGSFSSLPDGNSLVHSISYTSNRKQYPKESGLAGRYPAIQKTLGSSIHGSSMQFSLTSAAAQEKPEASLAQPDPTDWFPNYSEEHLLQEDGLDANVLAINFNQRMHVGQASTSTEQFGGVERFNWAVNPSADLSGKRSNGTLQAYSHVNVGSPPDAGYPRSKPSHFLPHSSPNFPSRLGQHSVQRFNHGNSTANRASERNNSLMPLMSGVNSAGQYSSSNGQLNNGTPWGRRGNNPITQIPPTRGRKDYGRIS